MSKCTCKSAPPGGGGGGGGHDPPENFEDSRSSEMGSSAI